MSKHHEFSMESANGGRGSNGSITPMEDCYRVYVCLEGQYADAYVPRKSLVEMRDAINKALEENPDVG